jgi:uncharacterized protein (UPF0332 family)
VSDAARHLVKARESLDFARYALTGNYTAEAGRSAYMAAYHAAPAFIVTCTGKSPRTHSGARSEFARLAREELRISRAHVSLLGWSYELKNVADYEQEATVSSTEAERAIEAICRATGLAVWRAVDHGNRRLGPRTYA